METKKNILSMKRVKDDQNSWFGTLRDDLRQEVARGVTT